ncbi:hypothetical protein GCM10010331_77010 [Streptomyces xanthochromogenes]|nr:hypothetical protein GCM10010331_77010 [Streptomyces xanthochromogenes]
MNHYFDRVDPQVASAVHGAVAHLEKLGADLVEVRLPLVAHVEATQWGLMAPEASAVHEAALGRSLGFTELLRQVPQAQTPVGQWRAAGLLVPVTTRALTHHTRDGKRNRSRLPHLAFVATQLAQAGLPVSADEQDPGTAVRA